MRLFILICVLFINNAFAQTKETKPLRLFVIGNSFSQNATKYLPQLSKEGGHPLIIGRAEIGGAPLQKHWDSVAVSRQYPGSRGKAYNGKTLAELLAGNTWDIVTLQQASILSADSTSYSPYAYNLYQFIKSIQPGAKVLLHQTWAYRSDSRDFSKKNDTAFTKTAAEMYREGRAAYHTAARYLGVKIIPVGDAFWQVSTNETWGFKTMPKVGDKDYLYPQLPVQANSLNVGYKWDDKQKLGFDAHHANDAGCYLGGLVWYAVLFNEDPRKLQFKPESVSEDQAAFFRETAWNVVRKLDVPKKH